MQGLRHVKLHNLAFTNYTQAPDGDLEDWFMFKVDCLTFAELESLVLHFDCILDPCEDYDFLQGGWVQGLQNCRASSVTVVLACGKPVRMRIPYPVGTFHVVIDHDLYIERPKGNKYKPGSFEGNVVLEADAVEVHDLCIVAASTPKVWIP